MFKPAIKTKLKARIAIEGPSGSGKTYSALRIARGLVGPTGKIAVIDTEKDSARLYADEFAFDHAPLTEPYTPEKYTKLIKEAAAAGYDCLIVDSITHEWAGDGGILDIKSGTPGNEFTAWQKVTPRHNEFVNAMLNADCHIIATIRSKQAYALEQNDKGKQVPKKLGMQAQQREGLDYEFTVVLKMDISHMACGDKDRTKLFPVDSWFKPTEETGEALAAWLNSGAEPEKREPVQTPPDVQKKEIGDYIQIMDVAKDLKDLTRIFTENAPSIRADLGEKGIVQIKKYNRDLAEAAGWITKGAA